VHALRKRPKIGERLEAFHLAGLGVYRIDGPVSLDVGAQDLVAVLGAVVRGADDRMGPAGQKAVDLLLKRHGANSWS
jgi:hypothetical protein